jgi:hypothetical protein
MSRWFSPFLAAAFAATSIVATADANAAVTGSVSMRVDPATSVDVIAVASNGDEHVLTKTDESGLANLDLATLQRLATLANKVKGYHVVVRKCGDGSQKVLLEAADGNIDQKGCRTKEVGMLTLDRTTELAVHLAGGGIGAGAITGLIAGGAAAAGAIGFLATHNGDAPAAPTAAVVTTTGTTVPAAQPTASTLATFANIYQGSASQTANGCGPTLLPATTPFSARLDVDASGTGSLLETLFGASYTENVALASTGPNTASINAPTSTISFGGTVFGVTSNMTVSAGTAGNTMVGDVMLVSTGTTRCTAKFSVQATASGSSAAAVQSLRILRR